jgi:CDP-diacylglycerol--serine O-phosphatidyltransferase
VRKIAIVPTLCTLGNAACGYAAIVFAAKASIASGWEDQAAAYVSGWLIFAAMTFDLFDGYLARRVKTASHFGAELDSLCDAISFGAAPGFLLIQLGSNLPQRLVKDVFLVVSILYMICAILRLARFNVQTTLDPKSHRFFRGLPSPAAAGCIASLVVLYYNFIDLRLVRNDVVDAVVLWLAPLGGLTVALLMVSRVPYVHLANRLFHRRRHFGHLIQLLLVVAAVMLFRELALVLIFWLYALGGPVLVYWNRAFRQQPASVTGDH